MFDEFRGQLKIHDILNYLDSYPLELPCRYSNKQACYTKVYIISNISFEEQYLNIKNEQQNTWIALKRRIHSFLNFDSETDAMDYLKKEMDSNTK